MKRLIAYNWNFGYLPNRANVKPRKIVITMQNVGGTDLNWNFKLPSDSQIEVEWADPGELRRERSLKFSQSFEFFFYFIIKKKWKVESWADPGVASNMKKGEAKKKSFEFLMFQQDLLPVAFPIEIRNVGSAKVQYKIAA